MTPIEEAAPAAEPVPETIPTIQPPTEEPVDTGFAPPPGESEEQPPVDNDHVADGAEQFSEPTAEGSSDVQPPNETPPVQSVGDADPAADTQINPVTIPAPLGGLTVAQAEEAELTRIAEEQRAKALQETEQQPISQPIVSIPLMITGFYVRVRLAADREFDTEAMITRVNLAEGTLNVTAFPDGEVPRPIGNVPYHPNKPGASIAWRE